MALVIIVYILVDGLWQATGHPPITPPPPPPPPAGYGHGPYGHGPYGRSS